jgi:hypothetical protein
VSRIGPIAEHNESTTIDVVRGRLERAQADELLSFWARRGVLSGEDAQRRLPAVVCMLRLGGELAGVSSIYATDVPLIGGRRFWIYRSLLDQVAAESEAEMIRLTFNVLEAEFDRSRGAPIGLCVLLSGAEERRRRPEAEWSDPRMVYAGYLDDGRQVRIAYFANAEITLDDRLL